jgi:hypothetical protein
VIHTQTLRSPYSSIALVAIALCAAVGATMSIRGAAAPVLIAGAAAALIALRWRAGVLLLLVALPFSGVPAFLAGSAGLGLRDLCIVAPLYIAFGVEMTRSRERLLPEVGIALGALAVFTALVLAQTLRAPTMLAGAIGVRVWLAYVPMLAIGYQFVRSEQDFTSILRITALVGLVPAAIALCEYALAVTQGDFGPFERVYGAWDLAAAQRFVAFTTDNGRVQIPRVPSTFTGVSQYFAFSLVAYACALAMASRTGSARWSACAVALAVGALASGARASYVAVPAIAVVALLLSGMRARYSMGLAAAVVALLAVVSIVQGSAAQIAAELPSHAVVTMRTALDELRSSFTILGHGTGWDTNAALRYGGVTDRRYIENWYAKTMLELGIAGLIAIGIVFASTAWRLLRELRALSASGHAHAMRRTAAPVVALLLVMMALLVKGPYIDLDPLNVYFWLLLGAVFGLFRANALPSVIDEPTATDAAGRAPTPDAFIVRGGAA